MFYTTDSWNTLVRLCAKRVSNEPDSATKHLQQNPKQASLNIRSCTSTSAWSTSSGCQLPCRSSTWWQTGMETSSRSSPTNLDPPAGDRCRAHCRCCFFNWYMAGDRDLWRAQRPIAGQAIQWMSERVDNSVLAKLVRGLHNSWTGQPVIKLVKSDY